MKQTRQAVCAFKQSILLRCLWFYLKHVLRWSFRCDQIHRRDSFEFFHTLKCCLSPTLMFDKPVLGLFSIENILKESPNIFFLLFCWIFIENWESLSLIHLRRNQNSFLVQCCKIYFVPFSLSDEKLDFLLLSGKNLQSGRIFAVFFTIAFFT